jgi:hypothetical protein
MARTQSLSRRAFFKNASAAVALLASAKSCLEAFTHPLPDGGEQKTPALAQPVVEIEENVYHFKPSDNGSGPLWCHGSTCLVRVGNDRFASGIETLPDVKPLNNCRWLLFQRGPDGWKQVHADPQARTREPSPLVAFPDGPLFLSANPTESTVREGGGPARPEILQFSASRPRTPFVRLMPGWDGTPAFTEHSYRSFAADGPNREFILFQNVDYTHAEWTFYDRHGQWKAKGKLPWPWGADYDKPQPIRVCYPTVALKDRAVHFCGVSDILEPNAAWRAYKKQLTGREWDYDFRRLFYTWVPDVRTGKFSAWVEIASREKTCGWIFPGDLWISPDGAAHVIWTERALDERLRQRFYPGLTQTHALNYAVVRAGTVADRHSLVVAREGESAVIPSYPRFQVTPDNRLFVFFFASGTDAKGESVAENRVMEIYPGGSCSGQVKVPLRYPLTSYFTATVRGGSPPSDTLELLGHRQATASMVSYARVRLG